MKSTRKNPKTKNNSDRPLRVEVKNGMLSISIGVDTLAFSLENMPQYFSDPKFKVIGAGGFAVDVKNELTREEEDGTMPVHLMLDKAMEKAIENGSIFVEEIKPNEPPPQK